VNAEIYYAKHIACKLADARASSLTPLLLPLGVGDGHLLSKYVSQMTDKYEHCLLLACYGGVQ